MLARRTRDVEQREMNQRWGELANRGTVVEDLVSVASCRSCRLSRRSADRKKSRHRELSFAELQAEVDVSIEILHRVIAHFKAQGKQVVVVGHSYGAFLTARYLWRKGPGAADRYLIMAGCLDMQREVVDGVLGGQYSYFPDAVNTAPVPPYPVPITRGASVSSAAAPHTIRLRRPKHADDGAPPKLSRPQGGRRRQTQVHLADRITSRSFRQLAHGLKRWRRCPVRRGYGQRGLQAARSPVPSRVRRGNGGDRSASGIPAGGGQP